ncbi:DUF4232 domain-containing protein [Streptomyces sp. NPDC096176]|uniref:DUF4232 domain-containing protein n=1 Tax=Streptomyces sp. NPDC096176 TaxID=3366079 RepID=UPI0037FE76D2
MRTKLIRSTAVAATALIAALSLTACQNDDGARDEGAAPSAGASSTQKPTTGTTDPAKSTSPSADKPGNGASNGAGNADGGKGGSNGDGGGKATGGSQAGGSDDSGPVMTACGDDVKVTYSAVRRPINHALLTMTNTGSKPCNAYHAPLLRFDEAQAATAINAGSKPQAVVTIAPGESAYASIMLASADGSGTDGRTAAKLAVSFAPRSGSGSTGAVPAMIKLPAGTYTDTTTTVTYWQNSMDDALMH